MKKATVVIIRDGKKQSFDGPILAIGTSHIKVANTDQELKRVHPRDIRGEWFPIASVNTNVFIHSQED